MIKHTILHRLAALGLSGLLLGAPFAEAITPEQCAELLNLVYIDPVSDYVLSQPTVPEMIQALGDPYSNYFTPEEYKEFLASMSDIHFVGIGIYALLQEDGIFIDGFTNTSPALAAGLQAGDLIVGVDEADISTVSSDVLFTMIQGEKGTDVTISYLRDGVRHNVVINRTEIVIPATSSKLIDGHIGYIRCETFGSETVGHFQEAIAAYNDRATCWIVDLRSNLGGATDAATKATNLFTGPSGVSYLRDRLGNYFFYQYDDAPETLLPVIVLMDSSSASSSELFASAIQATGSGIVVGSRSYGKGIAQTIFDQSNFPNYFPDGDAMTLTSDRFFSASGTTTDQIGVIPNLLVPDEMAEAVSYLLASGTSEDLDRNIRVDLVWRWYIDNQAAAADPEAMETLLNALLGDTVIWSSLAPNSTTYSPSEFLNFLGLSDTKHHFADEEDLRFTSALEALTAYHMVKGRADGLIHAQDSITRAELCQLIVQAMHCKLSDDPAPFSDVAYDAWYRPAVTAVAKMGFFQEDANGQFRPDDIVDHQQLFTVMARLGQFLNIHFYESFRDLPQNLDTMVEYMPYDAWAKPGVWLLADSLVDSYGYTVNLLWAQPRTIDPHAPATRDETFYTLYQILTSTRALPY